MSADEEMNLAHDHAMPQNRDVDQKKWYEELAKADERGNRFRLQLEEVTKRKLEVEDKLQFLER